MPQTAPSPIFWTPRQVAAGTLVVAGVAGAFVLFYVFRTVLFLLLIGVVLSIALKPLVVRLQRWGISRAWATVMVYVLVSCAAVAALVGGLPLVWQQTESIVRRVPEAYGDARQSLRRSESRFVREFANRLPSRMTAAPAREDGEQDAKGAPEAKVLQKAEEKMEAVAQGISYGGLLMRALLIALATMLLAFYWSVYEERTIRSLLLLVPPARREAARELTEQIEAKVGAYLRGQALLCVMMAGMVLVAYWLIGVPYVLTLAMVAGVLEAVPVFGPVLGAIPALLVALSVSGATAVWVLVAVVVIQQIESNLMVPRIMDRAVGVNAIVTLLAIAGFTSLLGLAGAVLAIPMAAVIQLLLNRWIFSRESLAPLPPGGRDAASLLRYQIRELLTDVQLRIRQKESSTTRRNDRIEESAESLARDLDQCLAFRVSPAGSTNGESEGAYAK